MPLMLNADMSINIVMDGDFSYSNVMDGELGVIQTYSDFDTYTGVTTVTPTEEQQILFTNGKLVPSDITIEPIPTNYGKITYNGSTITVT